LLASPSFDQPTQHFWTLSNGTLVAPGGKPNFLFGVTTVNPTQDSRSGPRFVSSDYHGDKDVWAAKTALRVRQYGFNAAGAWSDDSLYRIMPHTRCLMLLQSTVNPISSPVWEDEVEQIVKQSISPHDANLIGYYTDNELNWRDLEPWADKYFEVTSRLVRKYDPNHLILGVRFNSKPPASVLKASMGRVDLHSVNSYYDNPLRAMELYKWIHEQTGVKLVVSEFSFYARENRSGNLNSLGWGGLCDTQEQRAENFTKFMNALPDCVVGVEWFQWNDQPPGGRIKDGEDMNFGVVDINDVPYEPLIDAVRRFSRLTPSRNPS
jgi:hypothetical protein